MVGEAKGNTSAIVWLGLPARRRAMGLGEYCRSPIALKMRSRVAGATGRLPLMACETVVLATPARLATSLMVGRDFDLRGVTLGIPERLLTESAPNVAQTGLLVNSCNGQ